ncbi:Cysteine-rich membrane protein 2 [Spironucleus salmonicida]|uniref:Cysteine-rich membrane protein 2 n=1 Tax=Spironucleus salmonicida TaxID=348837 RepID=V6M272_9EUKA|nr:Cysteine-rich membrane protein 2 [Spironucleus salmonicida]|eukprot:EST47314.1 Cysteine-rich membrane protein 2 [Spironucleus salmonicida]
MTNVEVLPDLPLMSDTQPQAAPQIIMPAQLIAVQPVQGQQPLTIYDIYCKCVTPQFDSCHKCVGCCTACFPGWGLCCCICSYGADKIDKCDVCLSGIVMWLTAQFVVGYVMACIVGCKMCYGG